MAESSGGNGRSRNVPCMVRFETSGLTDIGKVRKLNQDHFLIADLSKTLDVVQTSLDPGSIGLTDNHRHSHVLLVADGMGGHAAGGEASALAVQTIRDYLAHTMPWVLSLRPGHRDREATAGRELKRALEKCHDAVLAASRGQPGREGMGTTMTLAYLVWPSLYLVHVGDSRAYLLRGRRLERLTRDHTYAQKLIEEGGLTPAQAEDSFLSNVLTRVIGGDSKSLEADAYRAQLEAGDTLMLCSDGLNKHVTEPQIKDLLKDSASSEEACQALIDAALSGGGTDNVTVVVTRILSDAT